MKVSPQIQFVLIGFLILLGLYGVFYLADANRPHDWQVSYWEQSKEPYGLHLFHQLLKHRAGEEWVDTRNALESRLDTTSGGTYFMVAGHYGISKERWGWIEAFLRNNGQVFIACESYTDSLFELPFTDLGWEAYYTFPTDADDVASLFCEDTQMNIYVKDPKDTLIKEWTFLDQPKEYDLEPLGFINDSLCTYVKVPRETGNLYIHTVPLAFTNYHLSTPEGLAYINAILDRSFEPPYYWDHMHGFAEAPIWAGTGGGSGSPLRFILSKPSLRWAWYLLLALLILYLLVSTKRRQRIIPVIEQPTNTSRNFLTNLARLQFQQGNHKGLVRLQQQQFLDHVKRTYGISPETDEQQFIEQLSQKTGKEPSLIRKIVTLHRQFDGMERLTEKNLSVYHLALNAFYEKRN